MQTASSLNLQLGDLADVTFEDHTPSSISANTAILQLPLELILGTSVASLQ